MEKRTKPAFTQPGGGHGKSSGCTVAKKWGPRGDGSPQEAGARCSHATPPPRHNIKVTRAFLGQSPGDLGGEPEVSKLAGLKKRKKTPKLHTPSERPALGSAGEAGSLTEGGGGGLLCVEGKISNRSSLRTNVSLPPSPQLRSDQRPWLGSRGARPTTQSTAGPGCWLLGLLVLFSLWSGRRDPLGFSSHRIAYILELKIDGSSKSCLRARQRPRAGGPRPTPTRAHSIY